MTRTISSIDCLSPWLIQPRVEPGRGPSITRMRIFCFHYAGATASIFRNWPAMLPPEVEVFAIQLPGREYRLGERLMTDAKEIAAAVSECLPPLLDMPYVVFGHSMGVLLGFDVIRLLRARGFRQPELLIASGRNAPQFRWRDAGLEMLPDEAFVAAVREYNGTPEALLADPDLRDLWLPRLRADLTVSGQYQYVEEPPLDCPVSVLIGEDDPLVTKAGLDGWRRQTSGAVSYRHYPGNHFFMHSAERLVLAGIRIELEKRLHMPAIQDERN